MPGTLWHKVCHPMEARYCFPRTGWQVELCDFLYITRICRFVYENGTHLESVLPRSSFPELRSQGEALLPVVVRFRQPPGCLGKPVQDRHGPAAVTGDDTSSMSLPFIQEQWEDAGEDRPGSRKTDLIALIGCTHGFLGRCTFVDISRT